MVLYLFQSISTAPWFTSIGPSTEGRTGSLNPEKRYIRSSRAPRDMGQNAQYVHYLQSINTIPLS